MHSAGQLSDETDPQLLGEASSRGRKEGSRGRRIGNREIYAVVAALTLALLAPALGGGTSVGAVGVLLMGVGFVAVALPAKGVKKGFLIGAGVALLVMLDWTVPGSWVGLPWRDQLEGLGFPVAWCASPEPWMSLRAWLVLVGVLVWVGWCLGQGWTSRGRRMVCEGLAVGIGGIALVAICVRHVQGWPVGTGLGPFANRNQTAALFAMGGFLTVVCGVERARRQEMKLGKLMGWGLVWLALLGVYTAALAMNRSRSGPLLFAGMTLVWVLTVTPFWKRRPETLLAGLSVGLLLGTIFLLTGSGVIERLEGTQVMDFRVKIFRDTVWMIRAAPWTGTGLGCFEAIFPLYRNASVLQERVLHPESDWLWLAAEAGLPGLVAMMGLGVWLALEARRGLGTRRDRGIQMALCVVCAGVLAHSLMDVPGHRLGTLMPVLLLLGLAGSDADEKRKGRVLRGAGLGVLVMGAGALAVMALKAPVPVVNGVELLSAKGEREEVAGRTAQGEAMVGRALKWAPLEWELYVERAQMEGMHGEFTEALGDFRRARFLEPNYAGLPFEEGIYWLNVAPAFVVEAWQDALKRTPRERRAELYQNMLAHAYAGHPEMHWPLWTLAATDYPMQVVFFAWATPEEFSGRMAEMLHEEPTLRSFSPGELRTLFGIWMQKGDAQQLASLLVRRPDWLKVGYRTLAEYEATHGEVGDAVELMEHYLTPPRVPPAPAMQRAEAVRRFSEDSGDLAAGMALYYEDMGSGREGEALETLRRLSAGNCPPYVHYLKGELLAKRQEIAEAWKELAQCRDEE